MYAIEKILLQQTTKPTTSILVIYTGGTFGMQYDEDGQLKASFNFMSLEEDLPEINRLPVELSILQMPHLIDSSDMSPAYWLSLVDIIKQYQADYDAFIILHGTDTMSYTASVLSFLIQSFPKPIILTGALLPLGAVRNDARENLITSIELATTKRENGKAAIQEVVICFNNEIIRGNRSTKVNTDHFDAFESPNYPLLAESGAEIIIYDDAQLQIEPKEPVFLSGMEENVFLIRLFPGIPQNVLDGVLAMKLKGLVIETYGNGNMSSEARIKEWARELVKQGVLVVSISQCMQGTVEQGKYEASRWLDQIGVVDGKDMTAEGALTKMMIVLGNYPVENNKDYFLQSICGEITIS
ncbi:MAG: asparaginase [Cyclobacteriaceae bacterium]